MENTELDFKENKTMEKTDYDMIRGDFSPEEAKEILNYLLDKKISFHHMKTFGTEIRFGEVDQKSVQRCEELKQTKAAVNEFIHAVKDQGKHLRIKSTLSFEIV